MNAMISLDGILSFIHALSLNASNKQWLGEKLLEEAKEERAKQDYSDFVNSMCGAWKDDSRTAEEIADDIRQTSSFPTDKRLKDRKLD